MKIGQKLKKLRKNANLTQEQAAEALGFKNHTSYSHWENDRNSPSISDLEKIAQVFNVSIEEVILDGPIKPYKEVIPREFQQRLEFLERENSLLRALVEAKGVELGKNKGATITPDFNLFRKKNPRFILWNQGISKRKGL